MALLENYSCVCSFQEPAAPRGPLRPTILPPAVVMAANNYYGLPQVHTVSPPPPRDHLPPQVVHGQPTVGQYTAAATAYPAGAQGTAVPVGYRYLTT